MLRGHEGPPFELGNLIGKQLLWATMLTINIVEKGGGDRRIRTIQCALHQHVRYLVMTIMYLFPPADMGNGPIKSQPTNSNGCVMEIGDSDPACD